MSVQYYTEFPTIRELARDRDPNGILPFTEDLLIDKKIQRDLCWDADDRNDYIESILNGFHQSPLVVVDLERVVSSRTLSTKDKEYFKALLGGKLPDETGPFQSAVDGQNRDDCLAGFLAGKYKFKPSKSYGMRYPAIFGTTGEDSVDYSQLSPAMRNRIETTQIPVVVYDKIDLANYRGLFNAVNSGKPTRNAEKRNGLGTEICNNIRTKAITASSGAARVNVSSDWYKRYKMHEFLAAYSRLFYSLVTDGKFLKTRATDNKLLTTWYKGDKGNNSDYIKKWDDFYENYLMKLWKTHMKDGVFLNISNSDIMEMFLTATKIYMEKWHIKDADFIMKDMFEQLDHRLKTIKMDTKDFEAWAIADRRGDKAALKELPVPVEKDYKAATDDVWRPNALGLRWKTVSDYFDGIGAPGLDKWVGDGGKPVLQHKRARISRTEQEHLIALGQLSVDPEVTPRQRKQGAGEVDHVHALSLGGDNTVGNLRVVTKETNRRKGKKTPEEYDRYLAEQEQQEPLVTEDGRAALPMESCPQQSTIPGLDTLD